MTPDEARLRAGVFRAHAQAIEGLREEIAMACAQGAIDAARSKVARVDVAEHVGKAIALRTDLALLVLQREALEKVRDALAVIASAESEAHGNRDEDARPDGAGKRDHDGLLDS